LRALLALPVAFVAGFSMGSLGFGAGMLSINGMVYVPGLRMNQLEAVANSLAGQSLSAMSAGGQWLRSGHCDLTVAACLGLCGLLGVACGAQLAQGLSDAALRLLSAGMMCLVLCPLALRQLYMSRSRPPAPHAASDDGDPRDRGEAESGTFQRKELPSGLRLAELKAILQHCAVGCAVGVVTSTIGVGDTPLLMAYMSSLGFRQRTVIGTVTVAQAPTLAGSALLHLLSGHAMPSVGVAVAAGMSIGATCGARVSAGSRVDDSVLQLAFAAFVFTMGGATAWATCVAQ